MNIIPLQLKIENLNEFEFQDDNLLSFEKLDVLITPFSLFGDRPEIELQLKNAELKINDQLFRGGESASKLKFKIKRIKISDGFLNYTSPHLQLEMSGINLSTFYTANRRFLELKNAYLKAQIIAKDSQKPKMLGGEISGNGYLTENEIRISTLHWQTEELFFNLFGSLKKNSQQLNVAFNGRLDSFLLPYLEELTPQGQAIGSVSIIQREKKSKISGTVSFDSFRFWPGKKQINIPWLNENRNYHNLKLNFNFHPEEKRFELDGSFSQNNEKAFFQVIRRSNTEIVVNLTNVFCQPLLTFLGIKKYAPLSTYVQKGTINIDQEKINARVMLNSRHLQHPFGFNGEILFTKIKSQKKAIFSAESLSSSCTQLSMKGEEDNSADTLKLEIDARIFNLEQFSLFTDYYIDLPLNDWQIAQGEGNLLLSLKRVGEKHDINTRIKVANFKINRTSLKNFGGEVKSDLNQTFGTFLISDSELQSTARLEHSSEKLNIEFSNLSGDLRKIFDLLDINAPFSGRITGLASYFRHHGKSPQINASFSGSSIFFLGQEFSAFCSTLQSDLQSVRLSNLKFDFKKGKGEAEVFLDFARKEFKVRSRINDFEGGELFKVLQGPMELSINGQGKFSSDPLSIELQSPSCFIHRDFPLKLHFHADLLTNFSDFSLQGKGSLTTITPETKKPIPPPGKGDFQIEFSSSQGKEKGTYRLETDILSSLIGWSGNSGKIILEGKLESNQNKQINTEGLLRISGKFLSLPNFAQSLNDFNGFLSYKNGLIQLHYLRGELGDGQAEFNGQAELTAGGLKSLRLNLLGEKMRLYPLERVMTDVQQCNLTLLYDHEKLSLSGPINFSSILWQREIEEPISFSSRRELSSAESSLISQLNFNLQLQAARNFIINNSFGKINGRLDLRLTGNVADPILLGTLESEEGEIFFSDKIFHLLRARIIFNDPLNIDPLINLESENYFQNYRIQFNISGRLSRAQPEFQSSPPLPPQDILALISIGELFKRPLSVESSSQLGGSFLITSELTREIKNRASKLLGIDLLQIEPILDNPNYFGSRITVGKSISRNIVVVYSTNISSYRQEIVYLQYQISPSISLIAMRNEDERFSIEIRLRRRN